MSYHNRFASYIREHKEALAEKVVAQVVQRMELHLPVQERQNAVVMYQELFDFFSNTINKESDEQPPETMITWSKQNALQQVNSAKSLSEIIIRYPPTREVFNDLLTELSIDFSLSLAQNSFLIKRMNQLLDVSLTETFYAYEELSKEYNKAQEEEMLRLSAPIVPVQKGIVVIPIVGSITPERVRHIMEHAVPKIVSMRTELVIADYSGIHQITPEIIHSFDQIGKMLRLMGVAVVSSGIRPEVVVQVVNSNLELQGRTFYSTVKQALETFADKK